MVTIYRDKNAEMKTILIWHKKEIHSFTFCYFQKQLSKPSYTIISVCRTPMWSINFLFGNTFRDFVRITQYHDYDITIWTLQKRRHKNDVT